MSLPDSWVETKVGKVVIDLQPGFAQKPGDDDIGMTPQIRTHNIGPDGKITLVGIKHVAPSIKELERYKLSVGDVVFNNTNSEEWVGKTAVFKNEGAYVFSNHMTCLRVNASLIDPDFLAGYLHLLWSMGYSKTRAKRWVNQAGIETAALASFKLPLPTLPEQQRIVEVLQRAEEIFKLRQQFNSLVGRIKRQLFFEMFGDPVGNPKQLKKSPIRKLFKVKSGEFLPAKVMASDGMYKVYGGNGINGLHDKYLFEDRKIVIGRVGAYCGAVHYSEPKSWITDNALFVSEKFEYLNDQYLVDALDLANLNHYAGQAGQPLISASRINPVQILVPEKAEQDIYAAAVLSLQEMCVSSDQAEKQLSQLLSTLVQYGFTGDLTANWREINQAGIEAAAKIRDTSLGKTPQKVTIKLTETPPAERSTNFERLERHWLKSELSGFQREVWSMLQNEWRGSVIVDDPVVFEDFCTNPQTAWRIENFDPSPNRVRRTLDQLAALGLIAKVSVPRFNADTQQTDYLIAFRPLRPEENTRQADLEMLNRALKPDGDNE